MPIDQSLAEEWYRRLAGSPIIEQHFSAIENPAMRKEAIMEMVPLVDAGFQLKRKDSGSLTPDAFVRNIARTMAFQKLRDGAVRRFGNPAPVA